MEALEGRATMDEAVAAIQQATRRYAKRQGTWFRRDGRINWIDATAASPSQLALQVADIVSAHSHA